MRTVCNRQCTCQYENRILHSVCVILICWWEVQRLPTYGSFSSVQKWHWRVTQKETNLKLVGFYCHLERFTLLFHWKNAPRANNLWSDICNQRLWKLVTSAQKTTIQYDGMYLAQEDSKQGGQLLFIRIAAGSNRQYHEFRSIRSRRVTGITRIISTHETAIEIRVWRWEMVQEYLPQTKCLDRDSNNKMYVKWHFLSRPTTKLSVFFIPS